MSDEIYEILDRKRSGGRWSRRQIRRAIRGVTTEEWDDAQLGAFLMAAAMGGLDQAETTALTVAMLESGERWELGQEIPLLGDKHSTGGVGDKVSLVLGPLLAACGQPVAMLTGRALGHTGGTADKLECIPGLGLELDRAGTLDRLRSVGLAIGVATAEIAPADRRLYGIRSRTGTVAAPPLVVASILSKKLASGSKGLVFDVKVGNGAFFPARTEARRLARLLVDTAVELGVHSSACLTDMSQPLGRWAGGAMELTESIGCLRGEGPEDLVEVVLSLGTELGRLTGSGLRRATLEDAMLDGRGVELLERWARSQGAAADWLKDWRPKLAPVETVIEASRQGIVASIDTRTLGWILNRAAGTPPDPGVALHGRARLGEAVEPGDELARLYLRRESPDLETACREAYEVADEGAAPELVVERIRVE